MDNSREAKAIMRKLDEEINYSRMITLLQDSYNVIESLVEEIESLERLVDEKDSEIKSLNEIIEEESN